MRPERIGDEVRRELSRFGPAEGMTEIVRAWPEAVGEQIALNAWPARISRDGKLHVATSSSAWAFELAQLEPKLLERLSDALGRPCPGGLALRAGEAPRAPLRRGAHEPEESRQANTVGPRYSSRAHRGDRRRKSSQNRCEGGSGEPLQGPLTAARSDTLSLSPKREDLQGFF